MTATLGPGAAEAVTRELVRLTLGGRGPARPELLPDAGRLLTAAVSDALRRVAETYRDAFAALEHTAVRLSRSDAERLARATRTTRADLAAPTFPVAGIPVVVDDTLDPGTVHLVSRRNQ